MKKVQQFVGIIILFSFVVLLLPGTGSAQYLMNSDSAYKASVPMSGHLWGYAFGDYYYKSHSDRWERGEQNEYHGIEKGDYAFAVRRIYLGHDFNITNRISTHVILSSEKRAATDKMPLSFKYFNLKLKDIWKGTDLIIGQSGTPALENTNGLWSYRSIERSPMVFRGSQSSDFGVTLKGSLDSNANYGYSFMVGNSTGLNAGHKTYPKFYGNLYGKFLDKQLIFNLYGEHQRLSKGVDLNHFSSLASLAVIYHLPRFTVGYEVFTRFGKNDGIILSLSPKDEIYKDMKALGMSAFVRGQLVPGKLAAFARWDFLNPDYTIEDISTSDFIYTSMSKAYDINTRDMLFLLGLDYTPFKRIHFMPNVMLSTYKHQQATDDAKLESDYDLVWRMTFYFTFGR